MDKIKHANFSTHKREENFSSVRCIEVFNAMFPDSKEETALSASNFVSSLHMLQKPIAFNVAYIDGHQGSKQLQLMMLFFHLISIRKPGICMNKMK